MKRTFLLVSLLVAVLAVGVWRVIDRSREEGSSESLTVRLKWLHQAQFAGFYAAAEQGLYSKENLDVRLLPGGVDQPALTQVVSGAADVGVTGADQVLLARGNGQPVVAIAAIYRQTPFVLFVKDSSRIKSVDDLRGARVGVKYGGNEEISYRAMLAARNLDSTMLREVGIKYDMTPFYENQVEVWAGYRINESIAAEERGTPVRLLKPEDVGVNMYADVVVVREDLVRREPERLRRFLAATMKGWDLVVAQPELASRVTRSFAPDADSSHEVAMMRASIPLLQAEGGPLGVMKTESWQALADILKRSGLLRRDSDPAGAFSNSLLSNGAR